jgi:hypothetical protein
MSNTNLVVENLRLKQQVLTLQGQLMNMEFQRLEQEALAILKAEAVEVSLETGANDGVA